MTPRDRASLAWSLDFAAQRLDGALALAAPAGALGSHLMRGVWAAACRELHYLEMLVRRLLVCLAGQVEVTSKASGKGRRSSRLAPAFKTRSNRPVANQNKDKPPLFPVSDRKLSPSQIQARFHAMTLGDAVQISRTSHAMNFNTDSPAPVVDAARLAARFAALADVLADPERHARRLALWRVRRASVVLRLGAAPALAKGGTLDLASSAYFEAERLAFTVLNRGWHGQAEGKTPTASTCPDGRLTAPSMRQPPGPCHQTSQPRPPPTPP